MANYFHVIFFSLIGGVFSLIGGVILLSRKKSAHALAKYATPFAAGALLAASFFDLLPESMHAIEPDAAARWVLAGIVAFFLLEHFLHWFHHHHDDEGTNSPAPLIVVGDSVHNLLDGIAIGAAFLVNVPTGIVAAIAVAAHEIPQEIGDFGLLLKFGYSRRKVLIINFVTAIMSTIGAVMTFWLGSSVELPIGALLAVAAGMFIYIAASDLIPIIHAESKRKIGHLAVALLLLGIAVVGVTTQVAHSYIDTEHDHGPGQLESGGGHDHHEHPHDREHEHDHHD